MQRQSRCQARFFHPDLGSTLHPRFFSPSSLATAPSELSLSTEEAHHFAHVLRGQVGTRIILLDGLGWEAVGEVLSVRKGHVVVRLLERAEVDREPTRKLTLAVSLPKGDRQKLLVEKLTELGVSRLIPLRCQRSVAQPVDSALARLEQHVVSACKQSGRTRRMEIATPLRIEDLSGLTTPALRMVAHPGETAGRGLNQLADGELMAAIGPEGGFAESEVAELMAAGWQQVGLGPRLLRIETAAIGVAAKLLLD